MCSLDRHYNFETSDYFHFFLNQSKKLSVHFSLHALPCQDILTSEYFCSLLIKKLSESINLLQSFIYLFAVHLTYLAHDNILANFT